MRDFWQRILLRLFVDNVTLDKYWRCHQMDKRSFFVKGRQFHLCARCTGIAVGYCFSPFLWLAIRGRVISFFLICFLMMALDGFTQLWGWRESRNWLRFLTGLGFGLSLPPFCVLNLIRILNFFAARI